MFLINLQGKDSIYEQIKSQIVTFIEKGILKANDKLPSVRTLAEDLGVNPNTVMKAYQELEKNGYIYTVTKKGAFVSKTLDKKKELAKDDALLLLRRLKQEGFLEEDIKKLLKEVYKKEEEKC